MNKETLYISYDEAINVYCKMIDASDGGFEGVRDEGGILATLDFVQNDMYYPDFVDKLCYLVFKFCSGHYFNDGNKRIALTLGAYFLCKNSYFWQATTFLCVRWSQSFFMWQHQISTRTCCIASWRALWMAATMTKN